MPNNKRRTNRTFDIVHYDADGVIVKEREKLNGNGRIPHGCG